MSIKIGIFVLSLGFVCVNIGTVGANVNYEEYQLLSADVRTSQDLKFLKSLRLRDDLDFWRFPRVGGVAVIMTHRDEARNLIALLKSENIESKIIQSNVQPILDEERILNARARDASTFMTWDNYQTWDTMEAWIKGLDALPTALVTVVGASSEGKPIYMVKVSNGPTQTHKPKKAIFIEAMCEISRANFTAKCSKVTSRSQDAVYVDGDRETISAKGLICACVKSETFCGYGFSIPICVHDILTSGGHLKYVTTKMAREISHTLVARMNELAEEFSGQNSTSTWKVATYILQELTSRPDEYKELLDSVDVYINPMSNPDGYAYTHHNTSTRLWRKTRSINEGSACIGSDPNRNFEFMWGGESTSPSPCSDSYHGTSAWSEPEVRAIRDAMRTIRSGGQEVQAYIGLHACGNVWLLSWGWTEGIFPEDFNDLLEWGTAVVEKIKEVNGTEFQTGQGADIFYGVGGASDDYARSSGIKYATTAELRCGTGSGFILPPEQIIPTALEILAGIQETGRKIVADDPVEETTTTTATTTTTPAATTTAATTTTSATTTTAAATTTTAVTTTTTGPGEGNSALSTTPHFRALGLVLVFGFISAISL